MAERIRIKDIAKMADVSVGTVDRVIHGRSGVSEASRKRVEEILKQLDYQPNMYASALASNKKYTFSCLLPQHEKGEYWTAVEAGIQDALVAYSDFNISVNLSYYDPFDYHSFGDVARNILEQKPDGIMFAPTVPQYTKPFTEELNKRHPSDQHAQQSAAISGLNGTLPKPPAYRKQHLHARRSIFRRLVFIGTKIGRFPPARKN